MFTYRLLPLLCSHLPHHGSFSIALGGLTNIEVEIQLDQDICCVIHCSEPPKFLYKNS